MMDSVALGQAYTAAWNSRQPEAVASFFAADGRITINGGPPWQGRAGVAAMAAGFFADIPDLTLGCDGVRTAGARVVYLWNFTGTFAATGAALRVTGWEEWQINPEGSIQTSFGWFDADDYARQSEAP